MMYLKMFCMNTSFTPMIIAQKLSFIKFCVNNLLFAILQVTLYLHENKLIRDSIFYIISAKFFHTLTLEPQLYYFFTSDNFIFSS